MILPEEWENVVYEASDALGEPYGVVRRLFVAALEVMSRKAGENPEVIAFVLTKEDDWEKIASDMVELVCKDWRGMSFLQRAKWRAE